MDNVNQPAAGGSKTGMWAVLIIAVIVIAAGAYFVFARDNGTNTNNSNVVGNQYVNSTGNQNTNTGVNSNESVNTSEAENSNIKVDTSDWKSYTNGILAFSLKYPPAWAVSTIGPDTLNYEVSDTQLTKGTCGNEGCAISSDVCEIAISDEPDPVDSPIIDATTWLGEQPFYKGADTSEVEVSSYDALRTKVAVTQTSAGGNQGMGTYYLISTGNGNSYLSAVLVKGFANSQCESEMAEILNTLSQ